MKGKSTIKKSKIDLKDKVVEDVPSEVMNEYKDVHLDIDIMFVNGVAFLTAIARHLRMIHARAILNRKHNRLKDSITAIKAAYEKRGFKIKRIHGNNEFAPLNDWLTENVATLEKCDTNQHVPQIERTNRFLKERIQCLRVDMPFKCLPRRFIIELVKRATIMINSLTLEGGVNNAISARAIVTRKVLHIPPCKLGEYVQAKVPTTNETDKERIVDALYIGPNNNDTGHWVFKLKTKEKISVPRVIPIPMPELIIKVVNEMVGKEGEVEGIEFANMFDEVTINDIEVQDIKHGDLDDDDQNNDNSTTTDDKYYEDVKEVEEEDEKATNLKKEVSDNELQRDYFNSNIDEISIANEADVEGDIEEENDNIDKANGGEEEIGVKEESDNEVVPEAEEETEEEDIEIDKEPKAEVEEPEAEEEPEVKKK